MTEEICSFSRQRGKLVITSDSKPPILSDLNGVACMIGL